MPADEVAAISSPGQFKALGHPTRHRLLFALGREDATISQLATMLGSNKGNIAHHLKVLVDAGLVQPSGTRTVRGGTEQYYRNAFRRLAFDDVRVTETAFQALAAEIADAQPDPFLILRRVRLTPEHAEELAAILQDLADRADDGDNQPRYGLLLGLYRPAESGEAEQALKSDG
jgi:DNA-binding transcriptional ArsR family regulator